MTKLYLDCDGVILDTINMSYKMLKENGIEREEEKEDLYRNLSCEELIIEAGEINNATDKIKKLTDIYDVAILTHVISEGEIIAKENYFKAVLPNVKVISVPKGTKKADAVDPKGNILVDDFLGNLDYWHEKGGISIKFSDSGKECIYQTITDLSELLKLKS